MSEKNCSAIYADAVYTEREVIFKLYPELINFLSVADTSIYQWGLYSLPEALAA